MEKFLLGESPLDTEISTVRAQIEALRHRRSLLSHTLLSSRKFKNHVSQSTVRNDSITTAKDLLVANEHTTIANLHRSCAGVTAFRVQDPDPSAVDNGSVLGIRFEVFAKEKGAFQTPYYVLLNQPSADGRLKVHKHTVPVCIPMQALMRRYLPYDSEDEEENPKMGPQAQDLPKFVRALRKELVSHHRRLEAYEQLKRDLGRRQGVAEVKMLDVSGKELELVFSNGVTARLRVSMDGKIERTAVGPSPNSATEDLDGNIKAYREIKKVIEGGDGRIESLVGRLKKRSA